MTPQNIKLTTVKERIDQGCIEPPEAVVSELLFRNSMAVLGAPEDSFKTHWALQLAISLAAGISFFTHSVKKANVVYLILEGGEGYILERLEEKVDALSLDRDEVLGKIHISDCSSIRLDDKETAAALAVTLINLDPTPDVVIFDPITYALNEDVRFSPEKSKLCRNLIGIAKRINGIMLPVIHCRKNTKDDDSMEDFLGTSIIAAAAATRIKLFRNGDIVNMYAKTRYAEKPDVTRLLWKSPLLKVTPEILKPREEARRAVLQTLMGNPEVELKLNDIINSVSQVTKHNPKTIRAALRNLEVEEKVKINNLPKSAVKVVSLVGEREEVVYAS